MRILFLSKDFYYNGGGERMLVNLANELSQDDTVEILTLDQKCRQSIYELRKSIFIKEANIKKRVPNFLNKLDYYNYLKGDKEYLNSFDVIIGVGIICNLLLGCVCKNLNAKCVAWEHFSYEGTPLYQKILRKMLFTRLDKVVVLTYRDLEKYKKINKNTSVIYNFTQMKYRTHYDDTKTFLFVGRLTKQKGVKYLEKVIEQFIQKNDDWKFRIIGKGELQESFKDFVTKNNMWDRVSYIEESKDIQSEIEKASCTIMTSIAEGLPMVLIESLACGVPSISFDTMTGPAEIIDNGKTGFIIPCYNINQYVEKMLQFADYKDTKFFFQHCMQNVSKFSCDRVLIQWRELLNDEEK